MIEQENSLFSAVAILSSIGRTRNRVKKYLNKIKKEQEAYLGHHY